jgi:hypothetical protein
MNGRSPTDDGISTQPVIPFHFIQIHHFAVPESSQEHRFTQTFRQPSEIWLRFCFDFQIVQILTCKSDETQPESIEPGVRVLFDISALLE